MRKFISKINHDKLIVRFIFFIIGAFLVALINNAIFFPNNMVVGGVSGIAVIVKKLTGLSTTIFINISNVILIIMCFVFLTKKEAFSQIVGCVVYPLMVTITEPIAKNFIVEFDSLLLLCASVSIIYGIASGIVYRAGFSTGGSDIILYILSKYMKKSLTAIGLVINVCIIILGIIVFNPVLIMYSVLIIFISNKITHFTLNSTSTKKMVFVISENNSEIKNYIMNEIHTGASEINVKNSLFGKRKQMLMCVIHNKDYPRFKNKILKFDFNSFIFSNTCYEVSGGYKYNILPF